MRFFNTISIIVLGFILVISVARFAGRGIIEMMGTDQKIPALFLTSHERSAGNKNNPKTSSLDDQWVIHMIVETFIFFLIGFGVSAIISIGAGVAIYLVGEVSNVTGL
jgi:ABC-type phosphate transport system permease subunit